MTTNIMQQYIKNTKSFLKNFTMLFLSEKYNEKISNELINSYIEARVYNFGDSEFTFFYKRIQSSIEKKKEELLEKIKEKDKETLNLNTDIYQFIFYADGVRQITDLEEFSQMLCEKRTTDYGLKAEKGLEKKFTKLIKEFNDHKKKFVNGMITPDFTLMIEKYINIDNTYKAYLDFNFRLPYIYSDKIINEVYNEGTINEDKLIITYMLLTAECIKDIEEGNFGQKYLVNFAGSLLDKDKKIKQTLRVINDPAIQDKIISKITYADFKSHKNLIYDYVKEGFKFAMIIDDSFIVTDANLRGLKLFNYILVKPNSKNYAKIKNKESKISNTVIYDV